MSNVPEELDNETKALVEKLGPAPQRDPQAAAVGKSKFLAEANSYRVSVSAAQKQRHMGQKENAMRLTRVPVFLFLVALIGVATVYMFMSFGTLRLSRSFVGNTFSTINNSLNSVNGERSERGQQPGQLAVPTQAMPPAGPHASTTNPQPTAGAPAPVPPSSGYRNQMVIKNGDIRLQVQDTDRAMQGVTQIVTDTQGYVISSRVWYQDYYGKNYKYATLTIGVPVDQFENAESRLRSLAVRVLDDTASGQDVTDQYVDLQSQLTNLEATRDRIKSFLDQAKTVDEALRINQQLSEVEGQIEQIKGQMNYLSNRSAFSTITINLEPELPNIVPTPTPTATPQPIGALGPWDAGRTTKQATYTLISAYRLIADFLIWLFVVLVPVLGPPIALFWLVAWLFQRRNRPSAKGQGA